MTVNNNGIVHRVHREGERAPASEEKSGSTGVHVCQGASDGA
jgi:hypothetical protein